MSHATRRNVNVSQYLAVLVHEPVPSKCYMSYCKSFRRSCAIGHAHHKAVLMSIDGWLLSILSSRMEYFAKFTAPRCILFSFHDCYLEVVVCRSSLLNKLKHTRHHERGRFTVYGFVCVLFGH